MTDQRRALPSVGGLLEEPLDTEPEDGIEIAEHDDRA